MSTYCRGFQNVLIYWRSATSNSTWQLLNLATLFQYQDFNFSLGEFRNLNFSKKILTIFNFLLLLFLVCHYPGFLKEFKTTCFPLIQIFFNCSSVQKSTKICITRYSLFLFLQHYWKFHVFTKYFVLNCNFEIFCF